MRGGLDKYFSRTTLENSYKALAESHHSKNGRHIVGSQPDNTPDSHSGILCTGSEISRLEMDEFDKEWSWSASAFDEACEHENVMGHIFLSFTAKEYCQLVRW